MGEAKLLTSAAEIMAAHPSEGGWQRLDTEGCGGRHEKLPVDNGGTVLWRRRREYFTRFVDLDVTDDPPLWVAERVGVSLCITTRWVQMNRIVRDCDIIRRDMGVPWVVSDGDLAAGMTVTLTTENGRWIWVVTGEPAPCCGGYTARWPD